VRAGAEPGAAGRDLWRAAELQPRIVRRDLPDHRADDAVSRRAPDDHRGDQPRRQRGPRLPPADPAYPRAAWPGAGVYAGQGGIVEYAGPDVRSAAADQPGHARRAGRPAEPGDL